MDSFQRLKVLFKMKMFHEQLVRKRLTFESLIAPGRRVTNYRVFKSLLSISMPMKCEEV
jgi:hypothetical protein